MRKKNRGPYEAGTVTDIERERFVLLDKVKWRFRMLRSAVCTDQKSRANTTGHRVEDIYACNKESAINVKKYNTEQKLLWTSSCAHSI